MTNDLDQLSVEEDLRRIWLDVVTRRATMPGEHALASTLGISRPRLREHLVRLEREGLIRRRRGADTVVNLAAADLDARFETSIDYGRMLTDLGFEVEVEVLEASRRPLDDEETDFFQVQPDWVALCITKRWRASGTVLILAEDVVAAPPSVRLEQINLSAEIAAIARDLRGTPIEWTIAIPGARALEPQDSSRLELPESSVALTLEVVGIGRTGERSFRAQELHVPGRVRFGFIRTHHSDPT